MVRISVSTPTFNRAHTLGRVYHSLLSQTYKNFEWIIIDDGSTDNTGQMVEEWIKRADFPIKYIYQENSGKHIAVNKAIDLAQGEYFTNIDSDDEIKPQSFEILLKYFDNISQIEKEKISRILGGAYNPETGEPLSPALPSSPFLSNHLDMRFKYKLMHEKWGLTRIQVMREFKYPSKDACMGLKLRFFPETITQDLASRKYQVLYLEECFRGYYQDAPSLTSHNKRRMGENIFLWTHNINNNLDYFWYDIPVFLKSFVGVSMCGFINHMPYLTFVGMCNRRWKQLIVTILSPIGFLLYRLDKQ